MTITKIRLADIVLKLESGSREKGGSVESGIISIGGSHISNTGRFKWDRKEYISKGFFDKIKSGKVKINDILIVKDGATTGKVGFVDSTFEYTEAAINEHVFSVEVDKRIANPKYVFYFLFSPEGQREILKDFRGATVGGISRKFTELVEIPLPDIETQNKVVAILDKANSLVSNRELCIRLIDDLLKSTFLNLFGHLINNSLVGTIEELQNNIAEGDTINYGVVQPGDDFPNGIPIVRVGDFEDSYINSSRLKRIDPKIHNKHKNSILKGGEVLITCVGATIGKVALVDKEYMGYNIVRATARINCGTRLKNTYLLSLLLTDFYQHKLKKLARTVAQPTLNIKQIGELQIPIPPINDQIIYDKFYLNLIANKKKSKASLTYMKDLFNSISQRVFSGELNFNVDFELEALIREIDLQKKENDLSTIVGDIAYLQRLLDKLNSQEFKEKDLYDKAKHGAFQLMAVKEEERKVIQEYDENSKSVKLALK